MSDYQAYLLRLQRHAERAHWGATLENVETGEVLRFRSMPELLAYLSAATTPAVQTQDSEHPSYSSHPGVEHA